MENKAAEILWKRSLAYNMRYRKIVSDGDSAVFSHLQTLNVYGNNFPITKEECVNHVSKRLGTGLRNTVKVCKAKGITLGGRSDGSLTEVKIVKLTKYYKNSVLRNLESVVNMKQDILATLHHCVSTDSTPRQNALKASKAGVFSTGQSLTVKPLGLTLQICTLQSHQQY